MSVVIYNALKDDIPTLSKTTVYNTLNLFIEKGIALLITIDESETRYDADTKKHGHFKCRSCGKVVDFDLQFETAASEALKGFQIDEQQVYYFGQCDACKERS